MEAFARELKQKLERELKDIPKNFRNDTVMRQSIKCFLYGLLKEAQLRPIPDFRPPRLADGFLDLIGVDSEGAVECAFAIAPLVELKGVKSLEALEARKKMIITFSSLEKKVEQSKFFLKPGIEHLHLGR